MVDFIYGPIEKDENCTAIFIFYKLYVLKLYINYDIITLCLVLMMILQLF